MTGHNCTRRTLPTRSQEKPAQKKKKKTLITDVPGLAPVSSILVPCLRVKLLDVLGILKASMNPANDPFQQRHALDINGTLLIKIITEPCGGPVTATFR